MHEKRAYTQNPQLYYWVRLHKQKGASAKVDYVMARGASPVPIEVKAGAISYELKSIPFYLLSEVHRLLK